ncbi:MAG: FG-GAP-like repeat-containing protein [Chitinophagales bacterium]
MNNTRVLFKIVFVCTFFVLIFTSQKSTAPKFGIGDNVSAFLIEQGENSAKFKNYNAPHQLLFNYQADAFSISGNIGKPDHWKIQMSVLGLYKGDECMEGINSDAQFSKNGNTLNYYHDNLDVQYINTATGMRQNFIVNNKPEGTGNLSIRLKIKSDKLLIGCSGNTMFASDEFSVKYNYTDLKVWDANNNSLLARMELMNNELALIVDDENAVYPITIDPISTNPDAILEGNQDLSYFGVAVANAGDVNGDGYDDAIVGAYNYDNGTANEGGAFIYHGSATGISTTPAASMESNLASIRYGVAVASAGDVNNDGYDDVIVGATHYTNGQSFEGRIYIYHGSPAGINTTPALMIESNVASYFYGNSVAGVGDINNDGYDDIAVGATGYTNVQSGEGAIYVYKGSASGILTGSVVILEPNQIGANMGSAVAGAGDVNGDGYGDIIAGASFYDNVEAGEGAAYIYHGSVTGITTTPARIVEPNVSGAAMGTAVSSAGDVNNDGYDDVVAGASLFTNGQGGEGKIFLYLGSATGIPAIAASTYESNQASANFGGDIAPAGDINSDGYDDIIVGAINYDNVETDEGRIFIFQGSPTGLNPIPVVTAEPNQASANFGSAVGGGGDFNGDGFDDVIAGAYQWDGDLSNEGAAFIYHGNNCTPSNFYPDVDGDGYGAITGMVTTCIAPAGYSNNNLDCNDANVFYNPATVWLLDADGDDYYEGTGSPIIQCTYPGTGYAIDVTLLPGDCDDSANYIYPGAFESVDGKDNDCDGLIDEDLNILFDAMLYGSANNEYFGFDLSPAGDLNNDGYEDVVIGSYGYNGAIIASGAVLVYYGSATGLNTTPVQILEGPKTYCRFGIAVAANGDMNNDGYNDLVVGADYYEVGVITSENDGIVYVYFGTASGLFHTTPDDSYFATIDNTNLGARVRFAGDVNGDGYDDILATKLNYSNGQSLEGATILIYGDPTGFSLAITLECDQNFADMGYWISGAGDVNNDGYDDILSSAIYFDNGQTDEGRVYIYHGSAAGLITTPAIILESNQANAYFGAVSKAGDVNNDGYDDIVIGAYGYDNGQTDEGRIYLYHGSATGIDATPEAIIELNSGDAQIGRSVANAGDINADGYDDIIVGGSYYFNGQNQEGGAWIFKGSSTGIITTPISYMEGNEANGHFGQSCATAGDINGDGADDFMVGAPDYDAVFYFNGGAVFVYLGICDYYFYADADGDGFGNAAISFHGCSAPVGYVANNIDCNDANVAIHPGATEVCNTIDDDCNAIIDEGATPTISISAGGATTFCQGGSVVLTATHTGATLQWKKNGVNIPGATLISFTAVQKATYTCTTISPCGASTSTGIYVNVNKNPTASITAGGATTFCAGGSVTLTEAAVAGCTYQWYKGASTIAGATSTNYIATTAGNYKCRVTKTATGCFKNSNTITVTVPCKEGSTADEQPINSRFEIYPNPNNGTFTISTTLWPLCALCDNKENTVEIYNSLSQLIFSQPLKSQNEIILIDNLPSGIYFVRLSNGNPQDAAPHNSQQKLIIE